MCSLLPPAFPQLPSAFIFSMQLILHNFTVSVVDPAKYGRANCFEVLIKGASPRSLVLQALVEDDMTAWIREMSFVASLCPVLCEGGLDRLTDGFPKVQQSHGCVISGIFTHHSLS